MYKAILAINHNLQGNKSLLNFLEKSKIIHKSNQLMVKIMNYTDEIDYEDMDDLALPDHIEWNNDQPDEFSLDALDSLQW